MVIRLKSFRIFDGIDYKNREVLLVVGQEDTEFHDVYTGLFSKDDPNEIIVDSLLLHKGTDQIIRNNL